MSESEKKILETLDALHTRLESLDTRFDSLEQKIEEEVAGLATSTQRQLDYLKRDLRSELALHYKKLDGRLDGLQRRLDAVDDFARSHAH